MLIDFFSYSNQAQRIFVIWPILYFRKSGNSSVPPGCFGKMNFDWWIARRIEEARRKIQVDWTDGASQPRNSRFELIKISSLIRELLRYCFKFYLRLGLSIQASLITLWSLKLLRQCLNTTWLCWKKYSQTQPNPIQHTDYLHWFVTKFHWYFI